MQSELDPEKFLEQNVESDVDSDTPHNSRKPSKLDSDSVASDHFNPSSDDSNKVRKKKKKKKKRKKSADGDKGIGETNLTDDEEDDLLKDLSTLLNEPSVELDVKAAGVNLNVNSLYFSIETFVHSALIHLGRSFILQLYKITLVL